MSVITSETRLLTFVVIPHLHLSLNMRLRDGSFDAILGNWAPKNDGYGHPFDLTDSGPPSLAVRSNVFNMGDISIAEIEAWRLASQPDSGLGEYAGSTSTDSRDGLVRQAFESGQLHVEGLYFRLPPNTNDNPD